jgi:transcriptional regulator with XRE-family HTH domain
MANFEERVRLMMKREKLSYEALAEYADASTQAVYKWLSKGSISDEKAMTLAFEIGLDWLWLKHGVSRVPVDTLYDIVLSSTSNLYLCCWNNLEIIALADGLVEQLEYDAEDLIGNILTDFSPNFDPGVLWKLQKLLHALGGMTEYSIRANFQDKHNLRAIEVRNKVLTTGESGLTYSISQVNFVEPNGQEDRLRSFKLHRRAWQLPSPLLIEKLCKENPALPWLKEFLLE